MKHLVISILFAGILACINATTIKEPKYITKEAIDGKFAPIAVLELFTSEGCSSCPPADDLLPQLAKLDSIVIPISFHVDYWNRLGWIDPFSKPAYSERQRDYARYFNNETVYTPQLVINGKYELVGSSRSKAETIIKKVLKQNSSVNITVDNFNRKGDKIIINIHAKGELKKQNLEVLLVQKSATMNIKAGENRGAKLTHTNVVRGLKTQELKENNETILTIPTGLSDDNWEIIVLAHQQSDLKITGAKRYSPLK